MSVHQYLVVNDDAGAAIAATIQSTALNMCAEIHADHIDGGVQWRIDLDRPFAALSTGERVLWRTVSWLAGQGGDLPSHTEARASLDADNFKVWAEVVGERLAGAW